ncbi:hypothetical protein [Clostridium saccharoperbutylacetonicum]|uniref:hypothetical protein n=1 Tax=Clostridium saccharoperbutylacetonicum TaxID=36745 RepID=UPI0039E7DB4B
MINVFIWGTGDFRSKVESIINSKNINTIAYIDNKKEMQGKFINDKTIINPNKINEYKYDYILIASQYYKEIHDQLIYLGINEKKIINSFKFIEDITIIEYMKSDKEYLYNKFEDNYNNAQNSMHIDSIITGLSYAECGIDLNTLKNKALNFALSGQDIYYDYNIAKNVIEGTKNKIKNVIIGLSYYSFQYDLSLSKSKQDVNMYIRIY